MSRTTVEMVTYRHKGKTKTITMTRKKRDATFGTLKRLKSGKFQPIYLGPDKKRYYASACNTEKQAREFLADRDYEIKHGQWKPPASIEAEDFGRYATIWVRQRQTRKGSALRPSTHALYERELDSGLQGFARCPLTYITPPMVREWHGKRCEQAGETTAGAEARLLHAILSTAVKDGTITRNPVPSELLRSKTGVKHRAPTTEELANIIAALPDKWRLCAYIAAFGGLRFGEWVRLERQDLDEVDGHVVVHVTCQAQRVGGEWLIRPPKSSEGVRSVSLPLWLTDIVNDHLKRFVGPFPASLIFAPDKNGTRYISESTWSHKWSRALAKAHISDVIRPHDLRHYFGSALADAGVGIRQLQNALGHGTARASLGYLESSRGLPESLADRLQRLPAATDTNIVNYPSRENGTEALAS